MTKLGIAMIFLALALYALLMFRGNTVTPAPVVAAVQPVVTK